MKDGGGGGGGGGVICNTVKTVLNGQKIVS